jgi:hypothetical protein
MLFLLTRVTELHHSILVPSHISSDFIHSFIGSDIFNSYIASGILHSGTGSNIGIIQLYISIDSHSYHHFDANIAAFHAALHHIDYPLLNAHSTSSKNNTDAAAFHRGLHVSNYTFLDAHCGPIHFERNTLTGDSFCDFFVSSFLPTVPYHPSNSTNSVSTFSTTTDSVSPFPTFTPLPSSNGTDCSVDYECTPTNPDDDLLWLVQPDYGTVVA